MPFPYPPVSLDEAGLRDMFEERHFLLDHEIRNPHPEVPVSQEKKAAAKPSAVLVPVVQADTGLGLLLTRRHQHIRFAGHICFPGGRQDPDDLSAVETALRETEEEIGLKRNQVEVLGALGRYFTQTGYEIVPVVALISILPELKLNPIEVEQVYQVPINSVLDPKNYQLAWHAGGRGHLAYHWDVGREVIRVAGPTVSLMVAFYEQLLLHRRAIASTFELRDLPNQH